MLYNISWSVYYRTSLILNLRSLLTEDFTGLSCTISLGLFRTLLQPLVEAFLERSKAALKAQEGPTQDQQYVPNKVAIKRTSQRKHDKHADNVKWACICYTMQGKKKKKRKKKVKMVFVFDLI